MLCMCHKSTLNVIDDLVKDYDTAPQTWKNKLAELLPVHQSCFVIYIICCTYDRMILKQILKTLTTTTIVGWALL